MNSYKICWRATYSPNVIPSREKCLDITEKLYEGVYMGKSYWEEVKALKRHTVHVWNCLMVLN